jgi:MFS family permease
MATLIGTPPASRRGGFLYVAAGISALGGLLFGYDTGVISGAILFIQQDFHLSPFGIELVVGSVLWGAVVGAACGGLLADRLGRRRSLLLIAVLFAAGAIGSSLAQTAAWLVACRVVVGVAIGVASFVTPLYISEVSPPDARGWLVSLNQLAITGGIVVSYLADYALAGARSWGWMLGLAVLPAAALGIGMVFMPETPRWLTARGLDDRARDVLRRCRGGARSRGSWRRSAPPSASGAAPGRRSSGRRCDRRWWSASAWPCFSRSPASTP